LSYLHDLGFIPKLQMVKGFAMLGGGLGSSATSCRIIIRIYSGKQPIPTTEGV
jgi:hypothetical protein